MLTSCLSQDINYLSLHGDPGQFLLDMRILVDAVIFSHQRRRTCNLLSRYHFVAGAVQAMEYAEEPGLVPGKLPFAAHKYPIPGNKYVIEDDHTLANAPVAPSDSPIPL